MVVFASVMCMQQQHQITGSGTRINAADMPFNVL